jgi:hypothetical protein
MHWSVTPSIVAGDPDATLTLSGTNIGDVPINVTRVSDKSKKKNNHAMQ